MDPSPNTFPVAAFPGYLFHQADAECPVCDKWQGVYVFFPPNWQCHPPAEKPRYLYCYFCDVMVRL